MLEIDRRGLPGVVLISEEFRSGVDAWRGLHGFDAATVFVRHPVQPLSRSELRDRADEVVERVVAALGPA